MRLLNTLMLPLVVVTNGIVKIRHRIIVLASILFLCGNVFAQVPYMFITQQLEYSSPMRIVDSISSGAAGSANNPTRLDFGAAFTVSVLVSQSDYTNLYSGKTLFLYMQDTQTGTGGTGNWWLQGTPVNVPELRFNYTGPQNFPGGTPGRRYDLTISTGLYPVLMNSGNAWTNLLDGSIIRPTLYVGYTANINTYANWGDAVVNFIDVWGYKNRVNLTSPNIPANHIIDVEVKQYDNIKKNLEDILIIDSVSGVNKLPPGNYAWYMNDQYGVSPYTHTVNNPNPWLNNLYQSGIKPWINTTHIGAFDLSNLDYWLNAGPNMYYTLYYYAIDASFVTNKTYSPYVSTADFEENAYKIRVKIKPYISPMTNLPDPAYTSSPFITNAFTIASQDYGKAAAGTQWGGPLPAGETSYHCSEQNLPSDNDYSIAQDIVGTLSSGYRPMDWYVPAAGAWAPAKKYDHTSGDGTGFMYIVNASAANGIFYQKTFTVCPYMNLQLSCWLMNICNGTRDNSPYNSQYRIKPNIRIQIWPGYQPTLPVTGTPLLDYYTGEIPMTGVWEKYSTPIFMVPEDENEEVTEVTVFYLSVDGGGDGNDFMMDDIQIQRTNGAFDFSNTNVANCLTDANDEYHLQAIWDTSVIEQMYATPPPCFNYEWIFYSGITDPMTITDATPLTPTNEWETLNSTSTTGNAIYPTGEISIDIPGDQKGTYKLEITASGGCEGNNSNEESQCASFSYYVFSPTPKPRITVNPDTAGITCAGKQAGLRVKNIAANIDVSKLQWYFIPKNGTTESPLLDSNGNQLTGDTITVNPTNTTTYIAKMVNCSDSVTYTMEVTEGSSIGFGEGGKTSDYVHRVCYTAQQASIPITYGGGSPADYFVFLNGAANADTLAKGTFAPNSPLIINLNKIKPSPDNFRKGQNTVTLAVIVAGNCNSIQTFQIRFISDFSVWAPGTDYTNWNNDANWYITDSLNNRYAQGGVPMACTNVVIPGNVPSYPELKADYSTTANLPADDNFDTIPKCNNITFQFGGEVAQLQYLQYVRAFVELNLGTYRSDSNFVNIANLFNTDNGNNYYPHYISRDRYYSMSAPLKEMFSGDFAFGGKPSAFMKYADEISLTGNGGADISLIQKWTNSVRNYNVLFPAGFGFGYDVYSGDLKEPWPAKYERNQKNLNSTLGIVRWPYYMNSAYADSINPLHKFTGNAVTGAGQSVFTYYEPGIPISVRPETDVVARSSAIINNAATQNQNVTVPKGNRFILENSSNVIPADTLIPVGNENLTFHEVLIGNPFMSHLDFPAFYLANSTKIGQYYRTWVGTSEQYYTVKVDDDGHFVAATSEGDTIAGDNMLIPPLQSFFVPFVSGRGVNFNIASMSKTVTGKSIALRSAQAEPAAREILKVTAANSRYSATVVIIHKPGEKNLDDGVPKLFASNGNIPDIYLIQDYKKEIIEINETPQAIPLEISTKATGNLKLTFTGLENFSSRIALKDTKTGETKTLSVSDNVYSFRNSEGDQKNRFFLMMNGYTGIDMPAPQYVSVFAANHRIYAEASSLDPIRSVEIYNLMGQPVELAGKLSATSYESRYMGEKGVYIIQIKTKNNASVTKKVIIY